LSSLVTVGLIYVAIPVAVVAMYWRLLRRLVDGDVHRSLAFPYLMLFAGYGGILLILLTQLTGRWSSTASLATAVLVMVGIPYMIFQAVYLWWRRVPEPFGRLAIRLSVGYPVLVAVLTLVLYATE